MRVNWLGRGITWEYVAPLVSQRSMRSFLPFLLYSGCGDENWRREDSQPFDSSYPQAKVRALGDFDGCSIGIRTLLSRRRCQFSDRVW